MNCINKEIAPHMIKALGLMLDSAYCEFDITNHHLDDPHVECFGADAWQGSYCHLRDLLDVLTPYVDSVLVFAEENPTDLTLDNAPLIERLKWLYKNSKELIGKNEPYPLAKSAHASGVAKYSTPNPLGPIPF